jgi:hypothetical protein
MTVFGETVPLTEGITYFELNMGNFPTIILPIYDVKAIEDRSCSLFNQTFG